MPSLDDVLAALFASLGPIGSLAALLLIFAVDAALFPALPEAWILITYTFRPETMDAVGWAAVLLLVAVAGDLLGTTILYALVRRILVRGRRMPRWLESGMRRWTEFLGVPDERAILLNRIAPVVPFVGAFIATLRWNYRRSMGFVAVGGLAKYAVLLYLVFVIGVAYEGLECLAPEEETIPRVVRESPQGHRPLVAVSQGKQGTLGGVAESRHESGSAADHPGFLEGGDDGIEEVGRGDAVRIDEQEDIASGRARSPIPALARSAAVARHQEGAAGLGQILRAVRAFRIRDEDLQGRSGLVLERVQQRREVFRLIPGRDDDRDRGVSSHGRPRGSRRGLEHAGHAATRRSYTRSRRRVHRSTE